MTHPESSPHSAEKGPIGDPFTDVAEWHNRVFVAMGHPPVLSSSAGGRHRAMPLPLPVELKFASQPCAPRHRAEVAWLSYSCVKGECDSCNGVAWQPDITCEHDCHPILPPANSTGGVSDG